MIRAFLSLSALLALFLASAPAYATCLNQCTGALIFPDCSTPPPNDTWPASHLVTFQVGCKTCCSAPGGPLNCSPMTVDASHFSVIDQASGQATAGSFSLLRSSCNQESLIQFNLLLKPGKYELLSKVPGGGNLILREFTVIAGGSETVSDVPFEGTGEKGGEAIKESFFDGGPDTPDTRPDAPDIKPDVPDTRPDLKPDTQPDAPDTQPELKPDPDTAKPDDAPDTAKPDVTPDSAPDTSKPDGTLSDQASSDQSAADTAKPDSKTIDTAKPPKIGCSVLPASEGLSLFLLLLVFLLPFRSRR